MLRGSRLQSGWQGASLVAITYVYFLIFAQFAFLKRLSELGIEDTHLKAVMAAMVAGGVLFSLLAPRVSRWTSPAKRMRMAFAICATASALSLFQLDFAEAVFVSFLIGAGLGLLTVTLVAHFRRWVGVSNPYLIVGVGTGLGYFLCNIPPFFNAGPNAQALVASLLCVAGAGITMLPTPVQGVPPNTANNIPFVRILAAFTALVWLDSAAFFIIQNSTVLKAETWQGNSHLWTNAVLHFSAAMVSAWLLARRNLWLVLLLAIGFLGSACLLLAHPASAMLASVLYPIGVSLYSVALVAYPSLIAGAATAAESGRIAGWIYAISGWTGSALGIGMGQNLGHVPAAFVLAACAIVVVPIAAPLWRSRGREIAITASVLTIAWLLYVITGYGQRSEQLTQVERGRRVYISEGCIHCHTQYVRPGTTDVAMWGPVRSIDELREDRPPLIGNRRQGPDLSQVGLRRSKLWLKMHFFNPAAISGASIMPSYRFLFRDERGNDLVVYLSSLRGPGEDAHIAYEHDWTPGPQAWTTAAYSEGQRLYERDCVTCHADNGATRAEWLTNFKKPPIDLLTGPYSYLSVSESRKQSVNELARITKFGIPGSDMAGHEYLSDHEVASIALWLSQHIAQPLKQSQNTIP